MDFNNLREVVSVVSEAVDETLASLNNIKETLTNNALEIIDLLNDEPKYDERVQRIDGLYERGFVTDEDYAHLMGMLSEGRWDAKHDRWLDIAEYVERNGGGRKTGR